LIEGGVFTQLPRLRIVVTALAFGGLAMAAALSRQSSLPSGTLAVMCDHVFIDTMWAHPAVLRASVDLLGADHVLAGTDWPIVDDGPVRDRLTDAMQRAGLSGAEQQAIAAGNCERLLNLV